jgi:hypothetical protein
MSDRRDFCVGQRLLLSALLRWSAAPSPNNSEMARFLPRVQLH